MTTKYIRGLTVQEAGNRICPRTFEACIVHNCMGWQWLQSTATPRGYCAQNVDVLAIINALPLPRLLATAKEVQS